MKKAMYFVFGFLSMAFMASGCATIMSGTKHAINVECEPQDSKILINGAVHKSPCSQDVERGIKAASKNKVVAEKEGYKPCELNLSGSVHPWVFGNIILGGLIGIAIDLGTGAATSVAQEDIKMVIYEDKPCDIYFRPRWHGTDDKWIKYGEKAASPSKEEKPTTSTTSKEDAFKNIKTGQPPAR
jgi:hypothetical protein